VITLKISINETMINRTANISIGKVKIAKMLLTIFLIVVAIIQIYPLVWLVFFSLKDNMEIFGGNVMGLPNAFLWKNYQHVLLDSSLPLYFFNSTIITFTTIVVSGILACMVSYAIARMKVKLNKKILTLFSLGLMVPIHAVLLPVFIMLRNMKMLNSYQALILPYIAFALPMAIFILVGFFQSLPKELEESAFLDGCSIYGTFFKIILPLVKPAIATVSIFTFLSTWNEMVFAITFISKNEFKTLTVGILQMVGQYSTDWGSMGAGLVIATLPTILVYMIFSNQVESSMTAGAVKG
jgi:raffinose/stachyose/melibiose transport system permease protein